MWAHRLPRRFSPDEPTAQRGNHDDNDDYTPPHTTTGGGRARARARRPLVALSTSLDLGRSLETFAIEASDFRAVVEHGQQLATTDQKFNFLRSVPIFAKWEYFKLFQLAFVLHYCHP